MSDEYRIDSHKLIYHPQRVAQWLEGYDDWEKAKKVYPVYLEVSPVGYCNHRCGFCAVDFLGYQIRSIPFGTLSKSITDMAQLGVKSIMFAGEGEPTLYKELPEILDLCTQVKINTSLTTNMVSFTEQNTENFVKNCTWIKVSINAGTRSVYANVHGTQEQDFDRVLENMDRAVSIKRSNGYNCTIGAQMLLLPDNIDTVLNLAELTKEAGLEYLVIKPYSQHLSSVTSKYENIDYSEYLYLENDLEKYNTDDFKVIFRKHTMCKKGKKEGKYARCMATPFFWGYIMADGNVYGCSSFLENKKFCYGNVNENSFQAIWEGERRKGNYEFVKNDMNSKNCRENCRMDEINRYLWELKHPGLHVNFI